MHKIILINTFRAFITERRLENYDVISSRLGKIAGHFTLWRNNDFVNALFQRCPGFRGRILSERPC